MPSATAIILTYNRLDMLQRTVASARWQTHGDLEILVVDNGSDADTGSWLASIDDPRLTVLTFDENVHPTLARNAAVQRARGEWIGFVDYDDLWAPDKVESMVLAGEATNRTWAYCGCIYIDPSGDVIGGRPAASEARIIRDLPIAYTIPGGLSGVMWRADALEDGGLLDDRMTYCEDWDLSLRLLDVGPPAAVNRPLVAYRQHPGAWSRGVSVLRPEFEMIQAKHADLRGTRRVRMAEHYRYVAAQAGRAGARREAAGQYLHGLRMGDLRTIPRLVATTLLPNPLLRLLRTWLMSDRRWMREGTAWLRALHQQTIPGKA